MLAERGKCNCGNTRLATRDYGTRLCGVDVDMQLFNASQPSGRATVYLGPVNGKLLAPNVVRHLVGDTTKNSKKSSGKSSLDILAYFNISYFVFRISTFVFGIQKLSSRQAIMLSPRPCERYSPLEHVGVILSRKIWAQHAVRLPCASSL